MPDRKPWLVEHIPTGVCYYKKYMREMSAVLHEAEKDGLANVHPWPAIRNAEDMTTAFHSHAKRQLLLVDLHSWTDDDNERAWVQPTRRRYPRFYLDEVASGSWDVAAVVLTGCRSGRTAFKRELRRINRGACAFVGNLEIVADDDHSPVQIARRILAHAPGGDDVQAFIAAQAAVNALTTHDRAWIVEHLTSAASRV